MAIKGIILENSYAVVDNLNINKKDKIFSFDFIIYKDDSKKDILLRSNYNIIATHITYSTSLVYPSIEELKSTLKLTDEIIKRDNLNINNNELQENSDVNNFSIVVVINPNNSEEDGVYKIKYSKLIEVDKENNEIISYPISLEKIDKYICIYLTPKNTYYLYKDNKFNYFNGLNSDLFFDNNILKKIVTDTNMLGIGYQILKIVDSVYNNYENV